jgi:hypothetical protein
MARSLWQVMAWETDHLFRSLTSVNELRPTQGGAKTEEEIKNMAENSRLKSAKVMFNPHNQNLESIATLVGEIVSRSGCRACGRLINLAFEFQGDPDPDFTKTGVISVETEGF